MIGTQERFSGYSCDDSVAKGLMDNQDKSAGLEYELRQHGRKQRDNLLI